MIRPRNCQGRAGFRRVLFLTSTFAVLIICSSTHKAHAEPAFPASEWKASYKKWISVEPLHLRAQWRRFLSVPPPPKEEITKRELRELLALKLERADKQQEIVRQIDDETTDFAAVIGRAPFKNAALDQAIGEAMHDTIIVVSNLKKQHARPRPRHLSRKIQPIIDPPGHPAYPSGHATQSITAALVLSEIFPSCREQLLKVARSIGRNREIAGVHYPSDTAAGQKLGSHIYAELRRSKGFVQLLQSAKSQLLDANRCKK